ncbi:centrosome-associated protein ALMS1 [Labeo rohita]|uniref:centrosome-associated protein ALMS1 n=1 Tax=Labeo rohita TaxID=84645 RepID=UPI0021E24641|nr:centrosome-associated protein ALMS1 [Labeo rohita]
MRGNVCVRHNMDSEECIADVNNTPAEIPCQQHGQNMHDSEASRPYTDPDNEGRPISNAQDSSMQPLIDRTEALQLEFQDSQLSPALTLLPCLDKSHLLSDSTFFHHTDAEFAPLRGFPDFSVMSERHPRNSNAGVTDDSHLQNTVHDQAALSQHPLEVPTALSEGEKSCCSLSQHSLSPGDHSKGLEDQGSVSYGAEDKINRHMEGEEQTTAQQLSERMSARLLLEFREADVNVAVSDTSAISTASKPASNNQNTGKSQSDPSMNLQKGREQPQGGSLSLSSSFQKSVDVSNITFRDSRMHSQQTTDHLHEQLLSAGQRGSNSAPASRHHSGNKSSHSGLCVTPAGEGVLHAPDLQRALWSSGHLTATDGSFLSSQPVSQSTPALPLVRPPPALTKLSLIHSNQEAVASVATSSQNSHSKTGLIPSLDLSYHHSSPILSQTTTTVLSGPSETAQTMSHAHPISNEQVPPPVLNPPDSDTPHSNTGAEMKDQVPHLPLGRVHSLPSLSYLQKVDAWKANQSSSRSFYDNLTLQGFDGVSPKKKAQDVVSDTPNHMLSRDMRLPFGANPSSQMTQPVSSSHSRSGSPRRVDVVGSGVCRGQASESPVNRSQSHSSLSSVVTSIQRDTGTHSQQVKVTQSDDIISATRSLDYQSSLVSGGRGDGRNSLAPNMDKSSVKMSPLISLGRFSDVSSNLNMSSTLSSSQGSYHGEQSMRASVGAASSVVSLEVDNYAPYWASRPASPPHTRELNIEDRIPMYLLNLGIDQSPSTILNPFTRRGPIREPEFSPTDLCTIKGSIGTPTKSTQPSEVDSLQKETFSSSSQLSADSSASVTHRLSVHEQGQPASDRTVKKIFSQADTPPRRHSALHPSSNLQQDAPQSEGSFGPPSQLSSESVPPPGPREVVKEDDDSFVGSGTLHEIRRLLGRAESLVSGRSSLTSSPGSHRLSESDTSLVSLGRNIQGYHNDTSLSAGGTSLLLTRSSSDSALKGSFSSSQGPQQIDRTTIEPATLSLSREESLKSRDLCVTPRRAEPEGCSAADPDKAKPPTATSAMQINVPSIVGNLPQNQDQTEDPAIGSSENSSHVSAEVESMSDSSSGSSLAARVARLLQSESPVSMVTSRPSTSDPEDSRAREWILMKVSGRRCESLELNAEDRERIEDIKRELLLNTKYTKWSSDSEGSSQSSVGPESQLTKGFVRLRNMENHNSDQLQKVDPKPLGTAPFYTPAHQDLEAKVHQIALKEGLSSQPFTSITISTTRHTPSPQSPSHYTITATEDLDNIGPDHETLESTSQMRLIPNVLGREKETTREGQHREEKESEETTDDDKENIVSNDSQSVQRIPHMDYTVTGSNQILSSAVSDSTLDKKSHLSHVHLTLSPKPKHQSNPNYLSRLSSQNTSKDVPLQRSVVSNLTDEHLPSIRRISTSNHTRSYEHREPAHGQNAHLQARYPQTFAPSQRLAGTSRTLSVQAIVPALLPYKPHGSSELFYVPQADPELSPGRSDTTVESSHPGSDDAVPPHFNTDILGSRELQDNIITPKHKEGIYSKRASMKRVSSVSRNGLPESATTFAEQNDNTAPEIYVSEKNMDTVGIDEEYKDEEEHFVPLHMEADYSTDDVHLHSSIMQEPKFPLEPRHLPSQPIRKSYRGSKKEHDRTPHDVSIEISSSLDQLWQRFSEKWSMEETRPTNDGETSLLDRLERLSRLIHNTTPTDQTIQQSHSRKREYYRRCDQEDGTTEKEEQREHVQLQVAPQQAWPEHEESQERVHRYPAERDESASVETSSSLSTIDTERLLQAFGPHRVTSKGLKSSDSFLRLHNTINTQKPGRRKPRTKHVAVSVATDDVSTDDSTVSADSLSSSSSFSHHSQRGVSQNLNSKRSKVKLVNKGVQAGDLEIVINGTRRHTRDVGTIFPSPGVFKNIRSTNMPGIGIQNGFSIPTASTSKPTQSLTALKKDTNNKNIRTRYSNGVSWFVSADELKCDGRKENHPQNDSAPCPSQAWFEPYTKTQPWREMTREPLKERQNQQEQERPTESITATKTDISDKPSALVRLSLQEALELHRPEFVSRSRERMKRLGLLVEERRLQAVFNREREELFNCPAPSRPYRPAAPVLHKRVIPRKEMVQRSKHWIGRKSFSQRIDRTDRPKRKYAQLPEVQKRREEERRQAEYRSYRLNAQLFNKKVTNRVLGRRAPWQ